MEGANKKRTLHPKMLLPFYGVPDPDEAELPLPRQQSGKVTPSIELPNLVLNYVNPNSTINSARISMVYSELH